MSWRLQRVQQIGWQLYALEGAIANMQKCLRTNASGMTARDRQRLRQIIGRLESETLIIRSMFHSEELARGLRRIK